MTAEKRRGMCRQGGTDMRRWDQKVTEEEKQEIREDFRRNILPLFKDLDEWRRESAVSSEAVA